MTIGILGNPLIKGKSDQGVTVKANLTPAVSPLAGRVVFKSNVDNVDQPVVDQPDATTTQGDAYGIATANIDVSNVDGQKLFAVTLEGHSVPVQVAGTFDDITAGIGFNNIGQIVQGDSNDAVKMLAGRLCSLTQYEALDENGDAQTCMLIDLFGGGSFPLRSV